jgi:hypothetical protein
VHHYWRRDGGVFYFSVSFGGVSGGQVYRRGKGVGRRGRGAFRALSWMLARRCACGRTPSIAFTRLLRRTYSSLEPPDVPRAKGCVVLAWSDGIKQAERGLEPDCRRRASGRENRFEVFCLWG